MFVLHVDIDAFFVQAEQLRNPSLQGKAVAVQQHQDIIAVNAAAKQAGVAKHMAPAEARRLLRAAGGSVAHVHLADGGRVSYAPYRELSSRLMKLLRALPWVAVLEKASIDEAYLLLQGSTAGTAGGTGWDGDLDPDDEPRGAVSPAAALQRAREAKAAAQQQLGLCVSVGVAPNRLLAKLASAAAKPDGVLLVPDQAAALDLLSRTPASRLPGYGGKAAEAFERHGIVAATDLQRYSQQQLQEVLGLKAAAAAQLAQWCRGVDATPVQDRGPPKSLSVQMSLTPQLLAMHPSMGSTVSAAGGRAGVFEPLVVGRPDFRLRVRQLMAAMGLDLLRRVREDSAEEGGRWPRTLSAGMRAFGAGRDQTFTTRSAAFPSSLLAQRRQQPQQGGAPAQQQLSMHREQDGGQEGSEAEAAARAPGQPLAASQLQAQQAQQAQQPLPPLEEALVGALESLVHLAASAYPASATVVELRLAATNFQAAQPAAAAAPITRFFTAATKRGAPSAGLPAPEQEGLAARCDEQTCERGCHGTHAARTQDPGPLQQQQQQQQSQQQQPREQRLNDSSRGGDGRQSSAGGAGSKRMKKAAGQGDATQPTILAFFKK